VYFQKQGGRGLMQIEGAYIAEVVKLMECAESKGDPLIQIVRTHQHHTNLTLLQTVNDFSYLFKVKQKTKQLRT
jgi:hypothetical protein